MAANSKREQIIEAVKAELETIGSISTVVRKLPTYKDLENFALTQLPVIALVGGLPVPVPHSVGRRVAGRDVFVSNLSIELFCYFQDNTSPDTTLSSILDDVWAKLYSDPTKGGLAIETTLTPDAYQDFWDPFYAFKLNATIQYSHLKGGI